MLSDFIVERASPAALKRCQAILGKAKARGAILVKDHRSKGVTMEPCSDWLADALHRCGIRVRRLTCPALWASRRPVKEVVFCFCNVWAMSPMMREFQRVKGGPWVALQTEHKGFRVYERAKCNYRWFLRHCDQVWDFGFDFCEGTTASMFLPTMWHPLHAMPSVCPRKTLDVVLLGQEDGSRRYIRHALSKIKGLSMCFANNLTQAASMATYRAASIGLMVPRQAGNFEFHRFSAYAISYTHVVALTSPKMDAGLAALLSPMVDFVGSKEAMVKQVVHLLQDREGLEKKIRQGHQWFTAQRLPCLLEALLGAKAQPMGVQAQPMGAKPQPKSTPLGLLEKALEDAKHQTPTPAVCRTSKPQAIPRRPNGKIKNKMMRLMEKLSQ